LNDDVFAPKGVLRKQVPQWLNMPRLRGMILVYKHPSERLGGSGAVYILLRRNKES
jgi:DNA-nicking Smr family endonuclease